MAIGYLAPLISGQLFDDIGRPLANGNVFSYVGGTVDTPLATYTTFALSVPHTNPIVLPASGRCFAYIPVGTSYKFLVTDADGNTMFEQDNVSIPAPSLAEVQTGSLQFWPSASTPSGYLRADGTAYSRGTYAALFAVIGTTFGAGDGSTTFNVPDMTGKFPFGVAASGTGSMLGATFGQIDHDHDYSEVLEHVHPTVVHDSGHNHTQNAHTHPIVVSDPGHFHYQFGDNVSVGAGGDFALRSSGASPTTTEATGITASATSTTATNIANTTGISVTTSNPAGSVPTGTTATANPPGLACYWIIKA